jgi:hypothetical protein
VLTLNQRYFGILERKLPGHTDCYHRYYILACLTVHRVVCEILAFHSIAGEVVFLLGCGTMSLDYFCPVL